MITPILRAVVCFAFVLVAGRASAQTIDDAFRADIMKLMDVTGASKLGLQMATMAGDATLQAMRQSTPELPERVVEIVKEVLAEEFGQAFTGANGMAPKFVASYARHFTHEDIRGLLAFYDTPLGKKTIQAMPLLLQEGGAIGQQWATENMGRIQGVLLERLKAEGFVPK